MSKTRSAKGGSLKMSDGSKLKEVPCPVEQKSRGKEKGVVMDGGISERFFSPAELKLS